ncbi:MAG TPA: hypothetical protein VIH90_04275 [Candidatus Saccharimonadales bacterium]
MIEQALRANDNSFADLGVRVEFDGALYGELLDHLITELELEVPVDSEPVVEMAPAPLWGMSVGGRTLNYLTGDTADDPFGYYSANRHIIDISAPKDQDAVNRLLLKGTRQWAGHLSGEAKEADERDDRRQYRHWGEVIGGAGIGATVGIEAFGGSYGAILGTSVGMLGGIAILAEDVGRDPYRKKVREFSRDPEMMAKYGQIVTYHMISGR